MHRRTLSLLLAATFAAGASNLASAQNSAPFKIGFILPMTGQSASTGKQIEAAIKLWQAQNGATVAGRKVEVIVKDDAGVADTTRRIAQEMVVNDKVDVLAGFGLTPLAPGDRADRDAEQDADGRDRGGDVDHHGAVALHRAHQLHAAAGDGADRRLGGQERHQEVVTFVADYGPGLDAEKFFKSQFQLNGGQIIGEIRSPLRSPDFAPFLQKVADLKPDAVFCFLPSGQGAAFMKQFGERGLDKSGIKLIATGDVTDDDQLNDMGDVALGVVNSHHYSAAHPSATNKKFVQAFEAANKFRPNFMAVAGYDGMHVIYNALAATKGAAAATPCWRR
jgi:branched-chain amino acid transport system substrate-binding protein